MPTALLSVVTPGRASLLDALTVGPRTTSGWEPISLDVHATVYATGLAGAIALTFWCCRQLCARDGPRRIVRAVAATGLVAAIAALAQTAVDPLRLYGIWQPLDAGARPFGPFVNRNHFATWALMAIPLALGYVGSSLAARPATPTAAATAAAWGRALGSRAAWVATAGCLLLLALVAANSRSGLLGAVVVAVTGLLVARQRLTVDTRRWAAAGGLMLTALLLVYARAQPLLVRAEETLRVGAGGRPQIWRDTLRVIGDFWIAGTGPGTFPTSMLVYQQADGSLFANQAHNHYLQLLAEGGIAMAVPLVASLIAFAWLVRRRVAQDDTSQIWMRLGAIAGLVGVAVQSCFETGLRLPGNAVLFAAAAAVAVHPPQQRSANQRPPSSPSSASHSSWRPV
jgi:O-antigen ligase